jgi:uncharacterized membrane protein SirB2
MACATLTFSLFLIRGIWMIRGSSLYKGPWTRIIPPAVDTTLLLTGIIMMFQIQQYPIQDAWLTAKISAVILYIVVGTIGLNRGKTRPIRIAAWSSSLIVFAYIVSVALTKNPLPFLDS